MPGPTSRPVACMLAVFAVLAKLVFASIALSAPAPLAVPEVCKPADLPPPALPDADDDFGPWLTADSDAAATTQDQPARFVDGGRRATFSPRSPTVISRGWLRQNPRAPPGTGLL